MKELHHWFLEHKRDFPWRLNPTPYRVWISEVMLQQTRAGVVIPYFERWMVLFPDVKELACAPLEKVIKAWEGLGYYSRARNLHKGARQIVEQFEGKIPSTRAELELIQGLGPYTIGAILSFGFRQRAAAVDGNVLRVLSRYFCIEENICRQKVKRDICLKAETLLDDKTPWITAEALIELGATLCSRNPKCSICPLNKQCQGYLSGKAPSLPIKNEEKKTTELWRIVLLIEAAEQILVRKAEAGRVMAGLYEFPYFEAEKGGWPPKKICETIQQRWSLSTQLTQKLPPVSHTFTRYKAHLYPFRLRAEIPKEIPGYQWLSRAILAELPFSSGHRRILAQ